MWRRCPEPQMPPITDRNLAICGPRSLALPPQISRRCQGRRSRGLRRPASKATPRNRRRPQRFCEFVTGRLIFLISDHPITQSQSQIVNRELQSPNQDFTNCQMAAPAAQGVGRRIVTHLRGWQRRLPPARPGRSRSHPRPFLFECFFQSRGDIVQPKRSRPGSARAVAAHFVVLRLLRTGNQARVADRSIDVALLEQLPSL